MVIPLRARPGYRRLIHAHSRNFVVVVGWAWLLAAFAQAHTKGKVGHHLRTQRLQPLCLGVHWSIRCHVLLLLLLLPPCVVRVHHSDTTSLRVLYWLVVPSRYVFWQTMYWLQTEVVDRAKLSKDHTIQVRHHNSNNHVHTTVFYQRPWR